MDALRASTAFSPIFQLIIAAIVAAIKPTAAFLKRRASAHAFSQRVKKGRPKAAWNSSVATALVQSELQTLVVFIELSASVRVLNAVLPMTVVVVVVGFVVTIEQCLVEESCTTQYSSASAGVANALRAKAQMIALFITSSRTSSRCRTSCC
jgi:hypothetical protein